MLRKVTERLRLCQEYRDYIGLSKNIDVIQVDKVDIPYTRECLLEMWLGRSHVIETGRHKDFNY